MKNKIAPSMMCVDAFKLEETLQTFKQEKIDYLHIDVMDGTFVPNFMLGTDYCKMLKRKTDLPLDIHLMINNPEYKTEWFPIGEGDMVSVHVESTLHLQRALSVVKKLSAKPIAALNPATPVEEIRYVLDDVCAVLLMTVNPGYAGQALIPQTLKKIADTRKFLDDNGYNHIEIEVDGNVSFENARLMSKSGANIFVAGSSSLFEKSLTLEQNILKLRKSIEYKKV